MQASRQPHARTGRSGAVRAFPHRQIELIRPRLIIALGKTAAVRLLKREASIASLRGQVHDCRGIPLIVTYHPAYLLRSLPEKAKAWEDLLLRRRDDARARVRPPCK